MHGKDKHRHVAKGELKRHECYCVDDLSAYMPQYGRTSASIPEIVVLVKRKLNAYTLKAALISALSQPDEDSGRLHRKVGIAEFEDVSSRCRRHLSRHPHWSME